MSLRVTTLKIMDNQGENLAQTVLKLRGAVVRLKALDNIPPDITHKMLYFFQTSRVPTFNKVFEAMCMCMCLETIKYTTE